MLSIIMMTLLKPSSNPIAALPMVTSRVRLFQTKAYLMLLQAVQREKHAVESLEKLEGSMAKLMDEAGARTRKEVDNVKQQANNSIQKLMDDIHNLEMVRYRSSFTLRHVDGKVARTLTIYLRGHGFNSLSGHSKDNCHCTERMVCE